MKRILITTILCLSVLGLARAQESVTVVTKTNAVAIAPTPTSPPVAVTATETVSTHLIGGPSTNVLAEVTPVNPTAINSILQYIMDRGSMRAGVGGTLHDVGRANFSAVLIQELNFYTNTIKHLDVSFGVCHTSCFSDEEHEGLGISGSIGLVNIRGLAGAHLPLFRDLSELRMGWEISCDVDRMARADFDARHTVASWTFGYRF